MAKRLKVLKVLSSLLFRTPLIKNCMLHVYLLYIKILLTFFVKSLHTKHLKSVCLKNFFCLYFDSNSILADILFWTLWRA